MDELFKQIRGALQDLESAQKMTVTELDTLRDQMTQGLDKLRTDMNRNVDLLRNSVTLAHAATTALGGTFASIEMILKIHATDLEDLKTRVEALERRPPAA